MSGWIINNYLPARNDVWLVKADSLGCDNDTCLGVSIGEYGEPEKKVRVYPNPVQNELMVFVPAEARQGRTEIRFHDLAGKLLRREILYAGGLNVISMKAMRQGIYFYQLSHEGILVTRGKIIKTK